MEEELNKKLAEWAGFLAIQKVELGKFAGHWFYKKPNGDTCLDIELPNFTQSLDACFKWLVPKLRETYSDLRVIFTYTSVANCSIYQYGRLYSRKKKFEWLRLGSHTNETPALALCKAIEKLIDGEK